MFKFTIDSNVKSQFQEYLLENNYALNPEINEDNKTGFINQDSEIKVEIECKRVSCVVSVTYYLEKDLIDIHQELIKLHKIIGNTAKLKVKEPRVSVTIISNSHHHNHFNYKLSALFFEILNQNNIHFSRGKIVINGFRYLDCNPVWINESDIKKVQKIINNSPLKIYRLDIIHRGCVVEL